jgi:NAD(P)-dependent dehydrogenase (short-subunit alcohol dehydrogenase family)
MKVLVIGASGLVGGAAASALSTDGIEVLRASRSADLKVDVTDPESVRQLFVTVGMVDAVVVAVGSVPFKPLRDLGRDDFAAAFYGKVQAQVDVVQIGMDYVVDAGSFTLTTGILARDAIRTGAAASMANGALESFVLAAAAEAPRGVRINAVSPSVLLEATGYHSSFPGFTQVPAAQVGQSYVKAVKGVQTGRVFVPDRS